jgi:hypothetical protein
MEETNPIIDQICKPFGWYCQINDGDFSIFAQALDTEQVYLIASGQVATIEPWKVRAIAMFTYWFLLTQGVQLPPIAIGVEGIEAMKKETFDLVPPQVKANRAMVGPEAFAVDPASIKSFVGANRTQHAPPVNRPIGVDENGLMIMPGASPRRDVSDRIEWGGR